MTLRCHSSIILRLRTWSRCPCPTSSSLAQSTPPRGFGCFSAFESPQLAALYSPSRLPPSKILQSLRRASPPRTQGPGRAFPARRKPSLNSRTVPSCSSHLQSNSAATKIRCSSPCLCKSPTLSAAFYSWCKFDKAMTGSSIRSSIFHFTPAVSPPRHPCTHQLRRRRYQSSNWNRHHL